MTARISLTPPRTLLNRLGSWYSRRRYGAALEPGLAVGHNRRVMFSYITLERSVARWNTLDPTLHQLALTTAAARINCSWCMDFGYWKSSELGLPLDKISKVPQWRAHRGEFTELELQVMEYAEAMTETEPRVTDELSQRLLQQLGEAAFVELTAVVALENLRSRMNSAFGLTSQGFSESCALPPQT